MNSHQRRKARRKKEKEAMRYETQMIPNPTLTAERHPGASLKNLEKYLNDESTFAALPKEKPGLLRRFLNWIKGR